MSAASQVSAVAELLEMILDNMPMRDLLLSAQLVNKYTRSLIQTSLPLRRKLFLVPDQNTSLAPKRNPVLDVLEKRLGSLLQQQKSGRGPLEPLPECWKHPRASWRDMLVSQPSMTGSFRLEVYGKWIGRDVITGKAKLTLKCIWALLKANGAARTRAKKAMKGGQVHGGPLKIRVEDDGT